MAPIRPQMRAFSTDNNEDENKKKGFFDFLKVMEETDKKISDEASQMEQDLFIGEIEVDIGKTGNLHSGIDIEVPEEIQHVSSLSQAQIEEQRLREEAA
jgi:hypothetical protein